MAGSGTKSTEFTEVPLIDDLLGNRDGSSARILVANLIRQVAANIDLSDAIVTAPQLDAAVANAETARDLAELFAGVVTTATSVAGLTVPATLTAGDRGYVSDSGNDAVDGLYEVQSGSWARIRDSFLAGKISVPQLNAATSAAQFYQTKRRHRNYIKDRHLVLFDGAHGEFLGIDLASGDLVANGFKVAGEGPAVIKDGVMPLLRAPNGNWIGWYDAIERRVRFIGDDLDQGGKVSGLSGQNTPDGLVDFRNFAGQMMSPMAASAPVLKIKAFDDGGGPVDQVCIADGTSLRRLTASPVDCGNPFWIAPGLAGFARDDGTSGLVCGPMDVSVGGNDISMGMTYGPSLSLGSISYDVTQVPVTEHSPSDHVLMFNGGISAAIDDDVADAANFASLAPALDRKERRAGGHWRGCCRV